MTKKLLLGFQYPYWTNTLNMKDKTKMLSVLCVCGLIKECYFLSYLIWREENVLLASLFYFIIHYSIKK